VSSFFCHTFLNSDYILVHRKLNFFLDL